MIEGNVFQFLLLRKSQVPACISLHDECIGGILKFLLIIGRSVRGIFLILLVFGLQTNTLADQYLTDSPKTMEYEQGAADLYCDLTKIKKAYALRAPGFEASIGVMTDFQVRINIPAVISITHGQSTTYGYGDLDIGFKYRFIHETDTMPQVAFYPKITLPSGNPDLRIGNGRDFERLPLWIQKTWKQWILSGGGGYAIDHNPRKFNYVFGGILLRHVFNPELTLGGELFARGPVSLADHSVLFLNLGGTYNFTPNIFLLFSAAHSIAGIKTLKSFMGLGITWGPPQASTAGEGL